ncbi:MAG: LptF/LptG family permease [Phycisphaerales bacterium]
MASRRPPLILWRYLTIELARTLLLVGTALIVLVSFAAAIRPLAKGDVGLGDAIRLMVLLAVPMAQFALPFAAGFAATMVYHRFGSDNEAVACRAGGIPQRSILVPAMFIGLVLALIVAALSNSVMPRFFRAAEHIVARDVARVIIAPIRTGRPIRLGNWDLYADEIYRPELPRGSVAMDHLILLGVIGAEIDPEGVTRQFISARRVDMWLTEATPEETGTGEAGTSVQLAFTEPTGLIPEGDVNFSIGTLGTGRLILPSSFSDDPKMLTFREMREARRDPRLMDAADRRARQLALEIGRQRVASAIGDRVQYDGRLVLQREGELISIEADRIAPEGERWRLSSTRGDLNEPLIRVVVTSDRGFSRTHFAQGATLRFSDSQGLTGGLGMSGIQVAEPDERGSDASPLVLTLELERVVTLDSAMAGADGATETGPGADAARAAANLGAQQDRLPYSGLVLASERLLAESDWPVEALLERAEELELAGLSNLGVQRAAEQLRDRVERQDREIVSKMHERVAYVFAVLLMAVISAILALRLRDSLPLPVFMWSFFPALAAVITISTGQNMMQKAGGPGIFVLWGGVVLLACFGVQQYRALVRI